MSRPKPLSLSRRRKHSESRGRTLRFETLETRQVFSGDSVAWNNSGALTMSFVPDGTNVGTHDSSLFEKLSNFQASDWQAAIVRGFRTWAQETNVNVGVVSDNGDPLGTQAPEHGDDRFGDIRVGAVPMSDDIWAVSIPHERTMAGSWAGDLLLNSNAHFNTIDEIYSVALHEAGHVLGLEHSTDPNSPMYFHGASQPKKPTSADVTSLQSLYGARRADFNDLAKVNDTQGNATTLKFDTTVEDGLPPYDGTTPLLIYGDITRRSDVDFFEVPTLTGYTGPMTFKVYTAGLSELVTHVSLIDKKGKVLSQADEVAGTPGLVSVTLPAATDEKYYLKVEAAQADSMGFGLYGLVVTYDRKLTVSSQKIDSVVHEAARIQSADNKALRESVARRLFLNEKLPVLDNDGHTDDSGNGVPILTANLNNASFLRYQVVGTVSDLQDVDNFRVRSGDVPVGTAQYLTVSVESLDPSGLIGGVSVIDKNGVTVASKVILNGSGQYLLQASGIIAKQDYTIRIQGASTNGQFNVGNYALTATYERAPIVLSNFASGSLDADNLTREHVVYVAESQLFSLGLQSSISGSSADTAIWATIYDSNQRPVHLIAGHAGKTNSSTSVLLDPGEYRIQVGAKRFSDGPLPTLNYTIEGDEVSEPAGPPVVDPTSTPIYTCQELPGSFCYPGGTTSTSPVIWVTPPIMILPTVNVSLLLPPQDWWFWNTNVSNTNSKNASDTNNDGAVSSIDALLVINDLNANGSRILPGPPVLFQFLDVNNDGSLTPLDALLVINALNLGSGVSGEGEFVQVPLFDNPLIETSADENSLLTPSRSTNANVGTGSVVVQPAIVVTVVTSSAAITKRET